jgi:dTMP kinase
MEKNSLFLVIEGVDGVGKSQIARYLTRRLEELHQGKVDVKYTYEPHNSSCAGLFLRQVLSKKFSTTPETIALAFATNRLDHCNRTIKRFLSPIGPVQSQNKKLLICDRYYLSSLVYQSANLSDFDYIMELNRYAIQPDIIFYLTAPKEICLERMKKRGNEKEFYENRENFDETIAKYEDAIKYLRKSHNENIITIDASDDIKSVIDGIQHELKMNGPSWISSQIPLYEERDYDYQVFSLNGFIPNQLREFYEKKYSLIEKIELIVSSNLGEKLKYLRELLVSEIEQLSFNDIGRLFHSLLVDEFGYKKGERSKWKDIDLYKLSYELPLNVMQTGFLFFLDENDGDETIVRKILNSESIPDFVIAFSPDLDTREPRNASDPIVNNQKWTIDTGPPIEYFDKDIIVDYIFIKIIREIQERHLSLNQGNNKKTIIRIINESNNYLDYNMKMKKKKFND